jgi:hypothetical protein
MAGPKLTARQSRPDAVDSIPSSPEAAKAHAPGPEASPTASEPTRLVFMGVLPLPPSRRSKLVAVAILVLKVVLLACAAALLASTAP